MRAPLLIFAAAGLSWPSGIAGHCRACGSAGVGERFSDWVKPTFTDHDKLGSGEIVCGACLFCFSDHNEELGRRRGRPPQRFRNYSHFVCAGEWIPLSKADKSRMAELIYGSQVVIVATSGQKHLAFRCPVGWWQIEEATVRPFPKTLMELSVPVGNLYRGGFSKAEIETGRYDLNRLKTYGVLAWQMEEHKIRQWRGTLPLQLAVFLAQREGTADDV